MHLFLATNRDNQLDKVAKQRHCKGERHGMSKITDEIVVEIRQLFSFGVSPVEIGNHFKIHPSVAYNAAIGKTWAHVLNPCSPRKGGWPRSRPMKDFIEFKRDLWAQRSVEV